MAKTSTVTRSPSKSVVISLKGSKNTRVNLHSSPLLGFLGMQLLAIGLFLGKKLPLLGMIGKILHYYLGKTSIWSLLVLSRKAFITLNAIIGVFFILKMTGLDITTILSNYSILGNTYLEILQGVVKNSFNWIFDLLDMKIVPQDKPGNPGSWWNPWNSGGGGSPESPIQNTPPKQSSENFPTVRSLDEVLGKDPKKYSLREAYRTAQIIHEASPWYKDWHTYAYIAFGLAGSVAVIGLGMLIYSYTPWGIADVKGKAPEASGSNVKLPDSFNPFSIIPFFAKYFPTKWTLPAVDIRSLNPAHLVGYVKESYTSFVGNITQTQANNELDAVRYQRSLNATNESLYPFTPVTNNESLYFKIGRYFYGEDDTSKLARARHLKHFYKELGYDLNDRENPIVAAIHAKVYECTGFALRTDHERLAKKLNFVPNTPHDSPKAKNDVPLPGPESQVASLPGQGSSQPLTQEALDMLDLTSAIANKPIGPMSEGSVAESTRAFAEAEDVGENEESSDEDVSSDTDNINPVVNAVVNVAKKAAILLNEDASGLGLEPDDDLSQTIKPTQPSGNPYPYGSLGYFQWNEEQHSTPKATSSSRTEDPTTPTPSSKSRGKKPLFHSPLAPIRQASKRLGDNHSSEGEGDIS